MVHTRCQPRFGWAARPISRARRRALVVFVYVSFAAFMALMYAGYTAVPRWPWWLATLAAFVATAGAFIRLANAHHSLHRSNHLDEVDRALASRSSPALRLGTLVGDQVWQRVR
jgi:fatty acid desaturase